MFFLRCLTFLIAFTLNVQIKAKAQVLEVPEECLKMEGECSIKDPSSRGSIEVSAGHIDFAQDSILIRREENLIRLVSGSFFVRSSSPLKIQTKYAWIQLKKEQSVIVELSFDKVVITAFSGDIVVYDLNNNPIVLPQAYTNSFGKINSKGVAEVGFPRAANFKNIIKTLGEISSLNKKELYEGLKKYKKSWLSALDETQNRSLASTQKIIEDWEISQKQQAERLRLEKIEKKRMRDFFYKKTFLE
ncbi:MAG: hypothetical protein H6625_10890 [Bdellovibrionaceae bacterium]|nr:hypothetical protein [Pseudobdellovibrionaceae bacterium]